MQKAFELFVSLKKQAKITFKIIFRLRQYEDCNKLSLKFEKKEEATKTCQHEANNTRSETLSSGCHF
jgi:hypothetical protein